MGKIDNADEKPAEEKVQEVQEPQEAEDPVVKQLKELDDKYLAIEKEYDAEVQKLLVQYTAKQQPLLDQRKTILLEKNEDIETGTPALVGFWRTAFQNHPAFEEVIKSWDEPVLDFLQDIEKSHLDDTDSSKGFKLVFKFAPNPYFEQTELVKEYVMEVSNPYYGEIEVKSIKCTEIKWKEGKDVTIAKVAKKVKGGGAKKAKQKKEREEPRPSIFRDFFISLSPETKLTEEMRQRCKEMGMMDDDSDEEEDDAEVLEYLMNADHDIGEAVRDNIIPFAVRWYTGEASPEEDDDEWGDEDEEEEEDNDDYDSDEEESPSAGAKAGKTKGKDKRR